MPARGDHDARRRDVSQAVWEVLAAHGFGGLTLRAVAAHMGASTGLLTHYFPSKKALVRHALEVAQEHTQGRDRFPAEGEGLPGLRAALLDVMPLTPEAVAMSRVWVSFWDAALGDDELAAAELRRYERWRGMLRPHVEAALRLGQLPADADPEDVVATAAGFGHGLVVQALFDPARFPPRRQAALVDGFVALLGR
ncbi:TetR family transcriptional regulator [Catellatospora methionotrophica]|uniref:TetR family transcriptional regulator n=1 Tax=Catellatospora methionotrophica TaxID=121620 RepID=A0A8J3L6R0_9ACTN|nr:TetR/AcrR family transcriptional regulator [Catellatospora methionotrophica]GIG13207.1 TetR family transcriptional regulator [Catellatospora methionotrophica]